ncbi:MAG: hypothetical protein QW751_01070 [Candidatus Aenigmatarchaeota archaeon]|nr:hypothetical protein [Candidatus Aenigmarchaeota archaeon]
MKGIEALPLKYIVLVLVAAIIIAAVLAVVTGWTGTAQTGAEKLTGATGLGLNKSACDTLNSTGINCMWNGTYCVNTTPDVKCD